MDTLSIRILASEYRNQYDYIPMRLSNRFQSRDVDNHHLHIVQHEDTKFRPELPCVDKSHRHPTLRLRLHEKILLVDILCGTNQQQEVRRHILQFQFSVYEK